ncbi:MAG: transglutaminaseTgpA domain-containing protein [Polyangiales bacterium]
MSARLAGLGPLAVLTALIVVGTRNVPLGVVALGLLTLSAILGGALEVGRGAQRVILGIGAVAGFFLGASLAPESSAPRAALSGIWCNLTLALALPAITRGIFAQPEAGARLTLALGVVAFALAGQVRMGLWLPALGWAFVAACVTAMRAEDPLRPRLRALPPRRWAMGAAVLASAVLATAVGARVLPPLHARALERFMRAVRLVGTTGFDREFSLGSLESLVSSDEVVARVYGPAPEMLRGLAYNQYLRGRWTTVGGGGRVHRTAVGPLRGDRVSQVETVSSIAPVYFVPLEFSDIATVEGAVRFDVLGAALRVPGDPALNVWFRLGRRGAHLPAPPTPEDLALPMSLRTRLTPLAAQWVGDATDVDARVDRIVRALRGGYRYQLAVRRNEGLDPVVDFLFVHRQGNCEYFASAAAVVARAAGIPARVIGGYRVGEFNALGGFHIVRERNAHAWVEVWSRGRWVTVDPTPERAIPANLQHRTPWLRALGDAVGVWLGGLRRWFAALTATQLLAGAATLFVLWITWRQWRARTGPGEDRRTWNAQERPLPCLPRLDAQLARRGVARAPGETLERHAERVAAHEPMAPALRAEAAEALRDYAAARYGDGDLDAATARMEACAKRLEGPLA